MSEALLCEQDWKYGPLEIPKGTVIPLTKEELSQTRRLLSSLKNDGDVVLVTLAQLLGLLLNRDIEYYQWNRGDGSTVSPNKDRILKNGIIWGLLGEVVVSDYNNQVTNKSKLTQACFHTRGVVLLTKYLAGELSKKDLKRQIPIKYSADHKNTYGEFGRTESVHRTGQKLACPDLCYGEHIKRLREKLGDQIYNSLFGSNSGKLNQVATAIHNISLGDAGKWAWVQFYGTRREAELKRDLVAGSIVISDQHINKLAQIITEYYNLWLLTKDGSAKSVHKVGFFGIFLSDRFADLQVFPKNLAQIAANIQSNYVELNHLVPELCRSNQTNVIVAVERLRKLLHKRVKAKAA